MRIKVDVSVDCKGKICPIPLVEQEKPLIKPLIKQKLVR